MSFPKLSPSIGYKLLAHPIESTDKKTILTAVLVSLVITLAVTLSITERNGLDLFESKRNVAGLRGDRYCGLF